MAEASNKDDAAPAQTSRASSPNEPLGHRVWAAMAEHLLDRFVVRMALSVAIIVSLVPMEWVGHFDMVFLAIFGTEFALRSFALVAGPRRDAKPVGLGGATHEQPVSASSGRMGAIVLLVVDFVALLSFVPFSVDAEGARWLRLFRLTRMFLLVGYWAPLVRDLWSILARRERARQIILMGFVVGGLSFAGAVVLYQLGGQPVDVNGDGLTDRRDQSFVHLLWWSFRQVQDPGNMLSSPNALPMVLISVLLTVFGLFLVSFLIGLGTDVVRELLELTRMRAPGLRGHTVVVNITPSTRRLLRELMRYYRKLLPTDARLLTAGWFRDLRRRGFGGPRYLIVGRSHEPPDFLRQPELSRIVYRERSEDEEELIQRADLLVAKRIVLLADLQDDAPDAVTIETLLTLVERVREKEGSRELVRPLGRQRVVIAEILDESNVPAAHAALATGVDSFRGFVVPTEKLLALFFASVVRRPGLGHLLEELLTSRGHEIYTCFFRTPGLGFSLQQTPSLGRDPTAAMDHLLARGLARRRGRVIPLGLIVDREGRPGTPDFDLVINPVQGDPHVELRGRGFVAVADNFRSVRELAEALPDGHEGGPPQPEAAQEPLPELARTHRTKMTRVLVCGFRPGSIYMLEELFRSDPGGEVLVLVEDEDALRQAEDALRGHTQLVERGLMRGRHGVFFAQPEGHWQFNPHEDANGPSVMHLCVADWMASRHLVDLPAGFGHVSDLDAIVFVAGEGNQSDPRTTTALLKLEQLFVSTPLHERPRVLAEVFDGKLATRLEQRCRGLGIEHVRVFSIQELRAYFLFQSVVVPGFDVVYAELLGSWGQSFVHYAASPRTGTCSFRGLAMHLRQRGQLLVAVELRDSSGRVEQCVAPHDGERGGHFDLQDLVGVWVVTSDAPEPLRGVQRTATTEVATADVKAPDGVVSAGLITARTPPDGGLGPGDSSRISRT